VSSALLRIELTRAVTRALPALLPDARDLLLAFSLVAIDDDIVEGAMNEPARGLRSLDRCGPRDGVSAGLTATGYLPVSST
jgi:uncharacterized protein